MKSVRFIVTTLGLATVPGIALAHHDVQHADPIAILGLWLIMLAVLMATIAARLGPRGDGGHPSRSENSDENLPRIPFFTSGTAFAHCDVPCGIYDPSNAQIAAMSTARFLDLIEELGTPDSPAEVARLSRLTAEKEKHASLVKSEVVIIWGDYFKEAQIEQAPDIHTTVHAIMRKASACKQEIASDNGPELMALVNDFASAFWNTKGIESKTVTAPYSPNLPMVVPVLE
ncbi:MAG: superoxide dismutase, Ni [Pseudomonadota bacterium]